MDISVSDKGAFEFGPFRLDPLRRRLTRDGEAVKLPPTQFDTLLYLVMNPGRVVEKDELLSAVWGGRIIEEGNLSQAVYLLRRALQQGDGTDTYIVTAPGRGYRFTAEVFRASEPEPGREASIGAKPAFGWPPPGDPDRAPYCGLRALEAEDAAIFFGRDAAIIRGMDQLRDMAEQGEDRLLLVLGASGAGKSSFLRAGLWPQLALDDAFFLPLPVIRPLDAVISGANGLAVSLSSAFAGLGKKRPPGPLKTALAARGATALGDMLRELAALAQARMGIANASAEPPVVVLSIDQAEELFAAEGAAEAETFLSLLASVLTGKDRVLAIGTIRTERYHQVQSEALLSGVRRILCDLPPIPEFEYRQVVEGPAQRSAGGPRNFAVEPALIERLIRDATGADALPLLAFTLERLWNDYGALGRLTLDDYTAMGGVKGSIEAAVACALAHPERAPAIPAEKGAQNAALRAAFIPWLVRVDPATHTALRRPTPADMIPATSRAIVERFVAARLLVADRRDGMDIIEVAHESLLRQWPSLVAWLEADAADLTQMEEVGRAASQWERHGRRDEWLDHRAERLVAAEALLRREDFRERLESSGLPYVAAARAAEERDRAARGRALAHQARTQRTMWWALAAVAVVLTLGLGNAVRQQRANQRMQVQLEVRQTALDNAEVGRLTDISAFETERGQLDSALRISLLAVQRAEGRDISRQTQSLASAQLAGTLWLSRWRLVLAGHTDTLNDAEYSPDGTRIVTASNDGTLRIWDAATGRQIMVLNAPTNGGHAFWVISAVYSPDGTRIVSASTDQTARVWDAANGRLLAAINLNGQTDVPVYVAYSPAGNRILTAGRDHGVRIWDPATGRQIGMLSTGGYEAWYAAYSPDGSKIVTALSDRTARVWDAATGQQITVLNGHTSFLNYAAYSPDGTRIVTASDDHTARIWDAATGRQVAALDGHAAEVMCAVYSRDGTRILTASKDHTARIWDATTGQQIAILHAPSPLVSATYSPDGAHIVIASLDPTARVWNSAPGPQIAVLNRDTDGVLSAAYSADGKRILTASADHTARVWDMRTGEQIMQLNGHTGWARTAAYSPDGARIVTASRDSTARIWDAATGQQILVLSGHSGWLFSAAYSPDGARIVTASADRTARVWDAATGRQILVLKGHGDWVTSAAYSPDGAHIVTASRDSTARVWDPATGRQITMLNGHKAWVHGAAYSPDGKSIVTASADNSARVWDAYTGRQIAVLTGLTQGVISAMYSPDGTRIVTGGKDNISRVWDAATGRQIAALSGHTEFVYDAAFSPDGTRIVTASTDKTARIWDVRELSLSVSQMLAEACGRQLMGVPKLTDAEMALIGVASGRPTIDVCAVPASGP